jgi:hypothetical protein
VACLRLNSRCIDGIGFAHGRGDSRVMSPTARINTARRECLDALPPGRSPLAHLASFLEPLRDDPGWIEAEIREVESTVRRILTTLIAEPS